MEFGKEYFKFCKEHNNFDMNGIGGWHEEYFGFLMRVFGNKLNQKNKFLDVGAATGNYLQLFHNHNLDMYGCDMSQWYIDESPFNDIKHKMGVIVDCKIPFEDNMFDFVHMCQVIEHIPEQFIVKELVDIQRTMKSGALFYISTVGEGPAIPAEGEDPTHISCFSKKKWEGIFNKCGFFNLSQIYDKKIKNDKFAGSYDWVNFVLTK